MSDFYLQDTRYGVKALMRQNTTLGDFVINVDGTWHFWPNESRRGGMSEIFLRQVIGHLEQLNDAVEWGDPDKDDT